jgi:putative peptidoglycan lipid II flippase
MVKGIIKKGIDKSRNILHSRQENIVSAAFIMMVLVALTKIAGFVKLHILARVFGASRELDIFWSASTLPDLIYWIIVAGSINAALIPVFSQIIRRKNQKNEERKRANRNNEDQKQHDGQEQKSCGDQSQKYDSQMHNTKDKDKEQKNKAHINEDHKNSNDDNSKNLQTHDNKEVNKNNEVQSQQHNITHSTHISHLDLAAFEDYSFAEIFSQVINLVIFICFFLGVLVFIFAPQISHFIAAGGLSGITPGGEGFSQSEIELMAHLMRIMTLSPVIMGVSSVFSAAIQANKRFIVPALAPLFYNIGILIGTLLFGVVLDLGIVGLAWGVVLGAVLHLLIQIPLAKVLDLNMHFNLKFWNRPVKKIAQLALPRILALLGEQGNVVINTMISTRLVEGSLSAYKFGNSLYLLPVQLLGNTISQAALPTLSLEFKTCDSKSKECKLFVETFIKSFQQIMFLILPAVVFILVLRLPLVRLSLGAGAFDWQDTVITSWVLVLFSLAIVGQSLHGLIIRAFYAMNDTIIPLFVSVLGLIVSVSGSFLFTNFFSHYYDWRPILVSVFDRPSGLYSEFWVDLYRWFTTSNSSIAAVGGLPFSIGVASMVEVIVLLVVLNKRLDIFSWKNFFQPILRKVLASGVMLWVMYMLYKFWNLSLDTSRVISIFLLVLVIGTVGFAVYLGMCIVVDISEVDFFLRLAKKGVHKVKKVFHKAE